jgi:hypothetical protein
MQFRGERKRGAAEKAAGLRSSRPDLQDIKQKSLPSMGRLFVLVSKALTGAAGYKV